MGITEKYMIRISAGNWAFCEVSPIEVMASPNPLQYADVQYGTCEEVVNKLLLRGVSEEEVLLGLAQLREKCGNKAVFGVNNMFVLSEEIDLSELKRK